MHNALSDEKLYIEVRIFLSHLLQLSPGISRKQAFHHVQFPIQETVRPMILSYITSNIYCCFYITNYKRHINLRQQEYAKIMLIKQQEI